MFQHNAVGEGPDADLELETLSNPSFTVYLLCDLDKLFSSF